MGGGGGSSLDQHAEPAQGDSPQPLVTVTLESALPGEGGNMLATPAPHSSLVVGAEVEAAREQGFDAWQAAEELVQRSFVARCMMDARVGEGEQSAGEGGEGGACRPPPPAASSCGPKLALREILYEGSPK